MAYQAASPWVVARALRQQGLGDSTSAIPGPSVLDPFAASPIVAGDIASGYMPPGAATSSPSGIMSTLDSLAAAFGTSAGQGVTPLQAQTNTALANPPSAFPSWLEYAGIAVGVVLLLSLFGGKRR